MNYFMADGNVQKGPFPVDQLIAQGLKRDTLVWREGMPQWQRADTVPELAVLFTGYQPQYAPPPPPPVGGGTFNQQPPSMLHPSGPAFNPSQANSQKVAAGICGILIGGFGVHKFILGMTGPGLIMLLVTFLTCGIGGIVMHIIGIIEGIIYLTKTDEEFYRTYIVEQKAWF